MGKDKYYQDTGNPEPPEETIAEQVLMRFSEALECQLALIGELHSRLAKVSLDEEVAEKDGCTPQERYPEYFHTLRGHAQTIEGANLRLSKLLQNLHL